MDEPPAFEISQLTGMREGDAVHLVKNAGLEYRVIHLDISEWHTSDQRLQRITIEVQGDIVVGASFG